MTLAGDVWTIAAEPGEKNNAGRLQLPRIALEIIHAQPRFSSNAFVFPAGRGHGHYHFAAALKTKFDASSGVTGWRLHDLRRTARSLMSRAGVLSEHAERVLGHSIGGVEAIYNRHSYDAEKGDALRKLAALIERIVTPLADNIVSMREAMS
jgi:integrase